MTLNGNFGLFASILGAAAIVVLCFFVIFRALDRRIAKAVKTSVSAWSSTRALIEEHRHILSDLRTHIIDTGGNVQSRIDTLNATAGTTGVQIVLQSRLLASIQIELRLSALIKGSWFQNNLAVLRGDPSAKPHLSYYIERYISQSKCFFDREISEKRHRSIVCSICVGSEYQSLFAECIASQESYAQEQEWDYYCVKAAPTMFNRHPSWLKIPLLAYLFERGYDRVLFLDADALVTNGNFELDTAFEGLVSAGKCLMVTEDSFGINLGVMFWLKSDVSRALLDLVWLNDSDVDNGTWEQHSLKTLMDRFLEVRAVVEVEPDQRRFNSFPQERERWHLHRPDGIWKPGDFVCHFSGMRGGDLKECIRRYLPIRTDMS